MAPPATQDGELAVVANEPLTDAELNELFAASWSQHGWTDFSRLLERSLAWVTARRDGRLVGYVNVVGDGGRHAFILDTTVHPDERRRGLGQRLVSIAADTARAAGAEWLHVDYEEHLDGFYRGCGFRTTHAGLMRLT
ncbi:GNAT family N-acetyltransferase [Actinopolymorpha alba]|uniref:GNAT family N-acetyltransferase n=1 Tax=Actinopolymorpha alba TaxID=533267 RepID=UPI0003622457|nr:GNAT family N-acetyltransferase [Actinopolymorpha alba]